MEMVDSQMKPLRVSSSYRGLRPASDRASITARASSRKGNTRCELLLRLELWRSGLRYRLHEQNLPGRPDIVFRKARVVVFCDGDFWHGRNLEQRLTKLSHGHNAAYWVSKIQKNVERDLRQTQALTDDGWLVLRFWETDILGNLSAIVKNILGAVHSRLQ